MSDLKVRFLPKGGFNKNGAFIEYTGDAPTGSETEYQRQGPLRVDITCTDVDYGTRFGVVTEYEEIKERTYWRSIHAKGVIQPARWGEYAFSFLGDKRGFGEIDINIHENAEGESITLSGENIEGDLDAEALHYFFLEIELHRDRFSALLEELTAPNAELHISVRSDFFRGFYAEWSPSINGGGVIKFLNRKQDVENASEIPENFWRTEEHQRQLISDPDKPPVTIRVRRPLQSKDS